MELPDHIKSRMAETNVRLKQMANAAGLEMVFATRIPNTRIAHEATEYARQKGKGFEFHHVVFEKFYGYGEDISKWDVLRDAALQVGLDAEEMPPLTTSELEELTLIAPVPLCAPARV